MASVSILQGRIVTPEVLVQVRGLGQQAVLDYESRQVVFDLPGRPLAVTEP